MNIEPVAWMAAEMVFTTEESAVAMAKVYEDEIIPLYTHPAKELNAGGEPVKNATYWKRQYNEMSALNDRLKSSLYHANEQIKYLEFHPAKTLTDEEIAQAWAETKGDILYRLMPFARAILRKAQEK